MSDRSLLTRVDDNGLVLPRWGHHLVKVATGAAALALFVFALSFIPAPRTGVATLLACVFSVAWFLSFRVEYTLEHHTELLKPDLVCDLALHTAPIAALIAYEHHPVPAALLLVACVGAYVVTYPEATP